MGVEIYVKKFIDTSNNTTKKVSFDETLEKNNCDIIDFRKWGMKWYFYYNHDISKSLDCYDPELLENKVMPEKLVTGSLKMIDGIFKTLGLEPCSEPIKAREIFFDYVLGYVYNLRQIISNLRNLYDNNDFDGAWKLLDRYRIGNEFHFLCKNRISQKIKELEKLYKTDKIGYCFSNEEKNVFLQINTNKDRLLNIINGIKLMYQDDDIDSAWSLIKNHHALEENQDGKIFQLEKIQNDKKIELKKIIDDFPIFYSNDDIIKTWPKLISDITSACSTLVNDHRVSLDKNKQTISLDKNKQTIARLETIISYFEDNQSIFSFDEIDSWYFEYYVTDVYKYLNIGCDKHLILIKDAINYIQFALFLYTCGIHGHAIYWSY